MSARPTLCVLLGAVCLCLVGCKSRSAPEQEVSRPADWATVSLPEGSFARSPLTGLAAPSTRPPEGSPSVVLVTVDTWRADRLGLYGSSRTVSPWLDELGKDAVVFDRAVAPSSWTWPTLVSIASGLHPRSHRADRAGNAACDELETLAEQLHASGWRTGFVGINGHLVAPAANFGQGFEFYWASAEVEDSEALVAADGFVRGAGNAPFFLWVHLFTPHCPFDPDDDLLSEVSRVPFGPVGMPDDRRPHFSPDHMRGNPCHIVPQPEDGVELSPERLASWPIASELQPYLDAYDAELRETDRILAELEQNLGKAGWWDRSWLVLTGDHGEEFMEHGQLGHGQASHRESTWVPLVIRGPKDSRLKPVRVPGPVSLIDIAPTVSGVLGIEPAKTWGGRDLSPALRGDAFAAAPVVSESVDAGGRRSTLYEAGGHRLLADWESGAADGSDPRLQLYAATDLMEFRDLLQGEPNDSPGSARQAAELLQSLQRWQATADGKQLCSPAEFSWDEETQEQLRALGYTHDGGP